MGTWKAKVRTPELARIRHTPLKAYVPWGRGGWQGIVRTSTSKDYFVRAVHVKFAGFCFPFGNISRRSESVENKAWTRQGFTLVAFSLNVLRIEVQAAWESDSILTGLKYRSSVVVAASRTSRQSGQDDKCRSISTFTEGESLPSKYMHIKWIVSRQLIAPSPSPSYVQYRTSEDVAFGKPKTASLATWT